MTRDEVVDLLTLIASYDRRTVGNADIAAWKLAVGDLEFADAQEAVVAHVRQSSDWTTPAHIRQLVKAARAARLDRSLPPGPPAEAAADPAKYQAMVRAAVKAAADGRGIRRALGPAPLPGEPPEEWKQTRQAIEPLRHSKREDALSQVAESRKERHAELDEPGSAS